MNFEIWASLFARLDLQDTQTPLTWFSQDYGYLGWRVANCNRVSAQFQRVCEEVSKERRMPPKLCPMCRIA